MRAFFQKIQHSFFKEYIHPGPHEVFVFTAEWWDEKRKRKIPIKCYLPQTTEKCPIVLFSHGLGASCHHYAYLGNHWASHGYVSIHVQHPGTDWSIFQGKRNREEAMREASQNVDQVLQRPFDIHFVLNMLFQNPSALPFSTLLNLERIGIAGHSMGAVTALLCGGAFFQHPNGDMLSFHDSRIRACIAMSPSSKDFESSKHLYSRFQIPSLHFTGTQDFSPIGQTQLAHRRVPFDAIAQADAILIVLKEMTHMAFSDSPWHFSFSMIQKKKKEKHFHTLVMFLSVLFLEAYLKENISIRDGLFSEELKSALEAFATIETKRKENHGSPSASYTI